MCVSSLLCNNFIYFNFYCRIYEHELQQIFLQHGPSCQCRSKDKIFVSIILSYICVQEYFDTVQDHHEDVQSVSGEGPRCACLSPPSTDLHWVAILMALLLVIIIIRYCSSKFYFINESYLHFRIIITRKPECPDLPHFTSSN